MLGVFVFSCYKSTTNIVAKYNAYTIIATGPKFKWVCLGTMYRISQGQNQGVGWTGYLSEGTRKVCIAKLIQNLAKFRSLQFLCWSLWFFAGCQQGPSWFPWSSPHFFSFSLLLCLQSQPWVSNPHILNLSDFLFCPCSVLLFYYQPKKTLLLKPYLLRSGPLETYLLELKYIL